MTAILSIPKKIVVDGDKEKEDEAIGSRNFRERNPASGQERCPEKRRNRQKRFPESRKISRLEISRD